MENCQITIKRRLNNPLNPERPVMVMHIKVLVRFEDGEYIASFPEAHISISGETKNKALYYLTTFIIDSYEEIKDVPDNKLGPTMLHQKQVLIGHFDGSLGAYEYQKSE